MSTKFELFRLTLLKRLQRDLLAEKDPTREEYLASKFSTEIPFTYRGNEYHFIPVKSKSERKEGKIVGRIGRQLSILENRPPEEGLTESVHEMWKASYLVIDPRHHEDGQKVAISFDKQVGSSSGLIEAIVSSINQTNPHEAYIIEVEPISKIQKFWQFAEKYHGQITSVTFEFIAPNMFGGRDIISQEMRDFRAQEKAEKVKVTVSSSEGLDLNTTKIRESVEYIENGVGRISARTNDGKRYSSSENKERTSIDETENSLDANTFLDYLQLIADRILGRE